MSLNWDSFECLPGAADANFELLCRSVVRRNYGRYGDFNALSNQPSVEFHLRLSSACSLGQPSEWFGWQCRWYDLPGGRLLGSTRRKKIKEAIDKAHKHLPNLTSWVLWTRRPLAADDQRWFTGLTAHFRLVQWTAAEIEEHLTGEAEIFRATYFGDLVLTPTALESIHTCAVAPVRRKWLPEAHQPVRAERELRRMLGESNAWGDLEESVAQITTDALNAEADMVGLTSPFAAPATEAIAYARTVAVSATQVHDRLARGDFDVLPQLIAECPGPPASSVAALPRRLRAARNAAAPTVTNVLAAAGHARSVLQQLCEAINNRLVAVLADAGCGKTELAAQLTAPTADRPAGILLHGCDLRAGDNLDALARRVVIQGTPARSMEALVAAIAAAGQRAGRRIPIIIDGLNEAEDPRDWKNGLASLAETLRPHTHVLVVCTLRPAFANESLPESLRKLEIPGFGHDTVKAVQRYFTHYRINPADADLPWDLLEHPLTLRIFCEVTNPNRQREVGVEAMPRSLTALFQRYLDMVAERIAQLAPRRNRYYEADIRRALVVIGGALWDQRARRLSLDDLRERIGDAGRPWDESLVRALEQDGVLLRDPRDSETLNQQITVAYDRLAGHIVANALLERHGREGLQQFLKTPSTITAFHEAGNACHPLGGDILVGLVGLTPRRFHGEQIWRMVDEQPLRETALRGAARLDAASIDSATVEELAALATQPSEDRLGLFARLCEVRGAESHPLNAEFLDRVLRSMSVADRDVRWTEWVRRNEQQILDDVRQLEARWRSATHRTQSDCLRARWVMWLLTSTGRLLRDHATRALYWYGRGATSALFDLALDSLAVNDPYVADRAMAASYGVVIAHQLPDDRFVPELRAFLIGLRSCLFAPTPTHPTDHWLIRLYVQGVWDVACVYHPTALPADGPAVGQLPFASGPTIEPIPHDDIRAGAVDCTIHMDFENYTLGRLVSERRNYDMEHADHRSAVAHVRGTVWVCGWRERPFGAIDQDIAANSRYRREGGKIERYGKKYGHIGFYTHAGQLAAAGQLPDNERLSDVDIDPSFPETPPPAPFVLPSWTDTTPEDDISWLRAGRPNVPDDLLYRPELDGAPGPWVAVHARLHAEDKDRGRDAYGHLLALLVHETDADRLVSCITATPCPIRRMPDVPSDYYTFAGEIPWSPSFGQRASSYSETPYCAMLTEEPGAEIEAEILAHIYAWESYHSSLNTAGGVAVPSRSFSIACDLRGVPQSFDQQEADGKWATKSFEAPAGFTGDVLYLREDLLKQYAKGRRLVWWMWGNRRLTRGVNGRSAEVDRIEQAGQDTWLMARRGDSLCPEFALDNP